MLNHLDSTNTMLEVITNVSEPSMTITSNWWVVGTIIALLIGYKILFWKQFKKLRSKLFVKGYSFSLKAGALSINTSVQRSSANLYIANRIYIELVTRKAAIPFDEEHDVIVQIYDSWYQLFNSVRDEIKGLPEEFLTNGNSSSELIELTLKILNTGLRPHLTIYQSRFRKWYDEQKDSSIGQHPQDIQRNYPDYDALVGSMKEVNDVLQRYAQQLKKMIDG
jgi:hypothetical protein